MDGARRILEDFQTCADQLAAPEVSYASRSDWKGNVDRLEGILDIGREIGERKVERILTGDQKLATHGETTKISDFFYKDNEEHGSALTWGKLAGKQENALGRLVKTLPSE
jgi:hypothetical protein